MSPMFFQNELQSLLADAINVCKENSFRMLKNQLNQSFSQLIEVEAECRRDKVDCIIRALQEIEKEQVLLQYEYRKVLSITRIPAIEEYIKSIERYRKSLVQDKKRLEKSNKLLR